MRHRPGRPRLSGVTLVAATSVALKATVAALRRSLEEVEFAEALLLSDVPPPEIHPEIAWRRIDRIASRTDYSRFMLRDLAGHIATPHALCVQWDGFVLNGAAWTPEFLDYDYIGAPWPHFDDACNVGNGGFSLRSKRLLEACRTLSFNPQDGEDVIICRLERRRLEERGILFAPDNVARKFSYERMRPNGDEFGFHGIFNLVDHIPPAEALSLLKALEPSMLARNERWELLRWAISHGRPGLAMTMISRLARHTHAR